MPFGPPYHLPEYFPDALDTPATGNDAVHFRYFDATAIETNCPLFRYVH